MIKISKSPFELKRLAQSHLALLESEDFSISKKIDELIKDKKIQQFERNLYNEIKKNLNKIITGTSLELSECEKKIGPFYKVYISKKAEGTKGNHRKAAIKKANQKILNVFDYDGFTKKKDAKYAYELTKNLDVDVCLYCNRQYTSTLYTLEGKCRPTLDHFFDKGKFPYFALSFFNLIPSCYTCNSSLKNQQKFNYKNNLHPFDESMLDVLNFGIDIKSVDFINGIEKDFKITLTPSNKCLDNTIIERAQKNAEIFKLKDLYQGHKDYASEIIKKVYYYDETKIDELFKYTSPKGHKLFDSRIEAIEFALGNYIREGKLGKRTLAKFTRDLVLDLDSKNTFKIK